MDQEKKIQELAQTLKSNGLAASMDDALEAARRIFSDSSKKPVPEMKRPETQKRIDEPVQQPQEENQDLENNTLEEHQSGEYPEAENQAESELAQSEHNINELLDEDETDITPKEDNSIIPNEPNDDSTAAKEDEQSNMEQPKKGIKKQDEEFIVRTQDELSESTAPHEKPADSNQTEPEQDQTFPRKESVDEPSDIDIGQKAEPVQPEPVSESSGTYHENISQVQNTPRTDLNSTDSNEPIEKAPTDTQEPHGFAYLESEMPQEAPQGSSEGFEENNNSVDEGGSYPKHGESEIRNAPSNTEEMNSIQEPDKPAPPDQPNSMAINSIQKEELNSHTSEDNDEPLKQEVEDSQASEQERPSEYLEHEYQPEQTAQEPIQTKDAPHPDQPSPQQAPPTQQEQIANTQDMKTEFPASQQEYVESAIRDQFEQNMDPTAMDEAYQEQASQMPEMLPESSKQQSDEFIIDTTVHKPNAETQSEQEQPSANLNEKYQPAKAAQEPIQPKDAPHPDQPSPQQAPPTQQEQDSGKQSNQEDEDKPKKKRIDLSEIFNFGKR